MLAALLLHRSETLHQMLRRRWRLCRGSSAQVLPRLQQTILDRPPPAYHAGAILIHLPKDTTKRILGALCSHMDDYNLQRDCAGHVQIYFVCYIVATIFWSFIIPRFCLILPYVDTIFLMIAWFCLCNGTRKWCTFYSALDCHAWYVRACLVRGVKV
jgi:hypothetical protein